MRIVKLLVVLLLFAFALRGLSLELAPERTWPVQERDWTLQVIAHRGGLLEVPESTLAAFDHAVAVGADWLELDVHLTADGQLVVLHDDDLDRTTNGRGPVAEKTLGELQALDAGYWWPFDQTPADGQGMERDSKQYPWRGRGLRVPTLQEVFQRYPKHRMIVEIKSAGEDSVQALLELLEQYQRWDLTVVASFHDATLQRLVERDERVVVSAGPAEIRRLVILQRLGLAHLWRGNARFMMVPPDHADRPIITPGFLRAAHSHGMPVYAWTINDEASMHELIDMGVDGLFTDRPERLRQVLKRRQGVQAQLEPLARR